MFLLDFNQDWQKTKITDLLDQAVITLATCQKTWGNYVTGTGMLHLLGAGTVLNNSDPEVEKNGLQLTSPSLPQAQYR